MGSGLRQDDDAMRLQALPITSRICHVNQRLESNGKSKKVSNLA
jgi:hypothetical protein